MKGDPLAGIGQYMCGERWLFVRPIRAGDLLWRSQHLFSADLKTSTFGGGTGALVSHRVSLGGRGRRAVRVPLPRLLARRSGEVAEGGEEPQCRASRVHRRGHRAHRRGVRGRGRARRDAAPAVGRDGRRRARPDRQGAAHDHRDGGVARRHRLGRIRRRRLEGRVQEPPAGPEVLREEPARLRGDRAALPLGRRMGAAHGPPRGLRLRRDAHELAGERW